MKKIVLFISIVFMFSSCMMTDEDNAKRILEADGYTDIKFTGYDCFECSEDDTYATGFTATKNGYTVEGTVCKGVWKSSTIRIK